MVINLAVRSFNHNIRLLNSDKSIKICDILDISKIIIFQSKSTSVSMQYKFDYSVVRFFNRHKKIWTFLGYFVDIIQNLCTICEK